MHEGELLKKAAKRSILGVNGFGEKIGMPRSTLYYHFAKDRLDDEIKEKAVEILETTIDELFIKGNTKSGTRNTVISNPVQESANINYSAVPLIPVYAYAGYLSGYGDAIYLEDLPVYYTEKLRDEDKYRAFEVRGDSMDDGTFMSILEGYQVLGKRVDIDAANEKIPTQREYIIVHKEHGILLKEIVEHDIERGRIKCASYNSKYQDLKLNLSDLVELYYVKEIKIKKP